MPDTRVGLFGGFRVEVDGWPIPEEAWRQRKPALLKLLALAPRHKLHREQVMDALWPDLAPRLPPRTSARAAGDPAASPE